MKSPWWMSVCKAVAVGLLAAGLVRFGMHQQSVRQAKTLPDYLQAHVRDSIRVDSLQHHERDLLDTIAQLKSDRAVIHRKIHSIHRAVSVATSGQLDSLAAAAGVHVHRDSSGRPCLTDSGFTGLVDLALSGPLRDSDLTACDKQLDLATRAREAADSAAATSERDAAHAIGVAWKSVEAGAACKTELSDERPRKWRWAAGAAAVAALIIALVQR